MMAMLWHVRNTWPASAWFSLNIYRKWNILAVQGGEITVQSNEWVLQGDLLSIIIYVLGVIPLIRALHHHILESEHQWKRDNLQVWYKDDYALAYNFA